MRRWVFVLFGMVAFPAAYAEFPDKPTNLKALPRDMTTDQVVTVMNEMSRALGVECAHCHVGTGEDLTKYDFASDENPKKTVARRMLAMNLMINQQWVSQVSRARVTCWTCHRGKQKPDPTPPMEVTAGEKK